MAMVSTTIAMHSVVTGKLQNRCTQSIQRPLVSHKAVLLISKKFSKCICI